MKATLSHYLTAFQLLTHSKMTNTSRSPNLIKALLCYGKCIQMAAANHYAEFLQC